MRLLPGLEILGVQAYAGHVQHIAGYEARREANRKCLDVASRALRLLRESGLPCPILSMGGTGRHQFDSEHPDVTEIQAGSYALMDAEYLAIGSRGNAARFDAFPPALSLLTTVVSTNQKGFVTVDAGLKAVYHDGATPEVIEPGFSYDWFGDEYGKISGDSPLRLGAKLHLIVSHCDPTVNLFDRFFIARSGNVVDVWPIDLRGCSQ
jgi:D-serine deaminase-like pyridoxal phosphate-dependent protein